MEGSGQLYLCDSTQSSKLGFAAIQHISSTQVHPWLINRTSVDVNETMNCIQQMEKGVLFMYV